MQLLFEFIWYKKPEIAETLFEMAAYLSVAAAISFTILNFANNAGVKWIAILAIIDLAYFVCWKVCAWVFLLVFSCVCLGIKCTRELVFENHFNIKQLANDFMNK